MRTGMTVRLPLVHAPTVVAIFGPTGVGKTAVAIAIADLLRAGGEDPVAVSADALQLYAGLGVLTGAASAAERARLEHRMVGTVPVTETFSAGRYAGLAHAEIDALRAAGRRPIVVGGTGLYLRAALADLDLRPPPDPARRAHWRQELQARGAPALHAELRGRAPEAAARIAPTDSTRVTRALELLDAGHPPPAGDQLWTEATRVPTVLAALVMDRAELYARIDARVDAMLAAGAADEVRAAAAAGASATARKALGFEQLLAGDVDAMKQATRRYARRQLTWLRKIKSPPALRIDVTGRGPEDVAREIRAALP
jgi:tRNA dimethylallyltransferase